MLGRQSLGFRQDDEVLQFQKIVLLHLLFGQEAGFFLLGDQSPHPLASCFRSFKITRRLRRNLFDQKIQDLVTHIHDHALDGRR